MGEEYSQEVQSLVEASGSSPLRRLVTLSIQIFQLKLLWGLQGFPSVLEYSHFPFL